ncbi:hypothetical protein DXG03_001238, partial [Asterophora parasitica]
DDPKHSDLDEKERLKEAWAVLLSGTLPSDWMDVDVDRECIEKLEDSAHAGIAGNQQWGRDAGSHQDGWNPYGGLPYDWKKGDREGSEGELQLRTLFNVVRFLLKVLTHW